METRKVALVTGGSKGIGKAVCYELSSHGDHVIIGYNSNYDMANSLANEINSLNVGSAETVKIDVTDELSIDLAYDKIVEKNKKIDKLACCAGVENFTHLNNINKDNFNFVFYTNTFGQFYSVAKFSQAMSDGGSIVLTSSVSAHMKVREHMLYAASKAAIESFVKNSAFELGDKNIRINAISPGAVATDMAAGNAHKYIPTGLDLELSEWKEINNACKRIGNVKEIAKAYCFLLSKSVDFMTGSILSVDGGRL